MGTREGEVNSPTQIGALTKNTQDKTSSDMRLSCYCCQVDARDAWLLSLKVKNDLLPLLQGPCALTRIPF